MSKHGSTDVLKIVKLPLGLASIVTDFLQLSQDRLLPRYHDFSFRDLSIGMMKALHL